MTVKPIKSEEIRVSIKLDSTSRRVADSLTGKAIAAQVAKDSKMLSSYNSKNKR